MSNVINVVDDLNQDLQQDLDVSDLSLQHQDEISQYKNNLKNIFKFQSMEQQREDHHKVKDEQINIVDQIKMIRNRSQSKSKKQNTRYMKTNDSVSHLSSQ